MFISSDINYNRRNDEMNLNPNNERESDYTRDLQLTKVKDQISYLSINE